MNSTGPRPGSSGLALLRCIEKCNTTRPAHSLSLFPFRRSIIKSHHTRLVDVKNKKQNHPAGAVRATGKRREWSGGPIYFILIYEHYLTDYDVVLIHRQHIARLHVARSETWCGKLFLCLVFFFFFAVAGFCGHHWNTHTVRWSVFSALFLIDGWSGFRLHIAVRCLIDGC